MGTLRVLLDTHVWLWMWAEPERLRNAARSALEDPNTELHVSAVSAWEIATKSAAGRLRLPTPADVWLSDPRHLRDVTQLPISFAHAIRASTLPPHHRDPFDRMLVAQAQVEGLVLVSADRQLAAYEVESLPA
jgi:PIN domain nuclease of toxin-antitoxin system